MVTKNNDNGQWGRFLSYGLEMAVGVGLGVWAGGWLDRKYNWTPWGTLGCCALGFAAGFYLLIRDGLRANKD